MARGKGKKEYVRLRGDTGQHFRILAVMVLLGIVAFLPVTAKLYTLMISQYDYYHQKALQNQTRTTKVTADRGNIYDTNMNLLATSVSVENIYLDPHELKQSKADLELIGQELGRILELEPDWIRQQGKDTKMRYKQIAARVPEATAAQVRSFVNQHNISGIHLEPASQRYYPYGNLAAQVIGFTNASNTGSEGIEAGYNSYLEGVAGSVITTKGNNEMDMPFSYENYVSSQTGCSVVLTLDTTVQACLEKQMEAAIARYDVENGAFGLVMHVKTGQILAMATLGSYDPNQYLQIADPAQLQLLQEQKQHYLSYPENSQGYLDGKQAYEQALTDARLAQWRNRVLADGYEPGSTFKVLTMAAALDSGAIDLNHNFYCSGAEQIPGRSQRLHCWRSTGHGAQKTAQALQNSCNLAFAHIALEMGGQTFYEYMKNFGVMEKTGVDLLGESGGVFFSKDVIANTDKWGTASLTSASFGQTFKLTPLQLARGISAVVNGGYLMEPYIVSEVLDDQGRTVLQQEPTVIRQVIREETSQIMRQLLESVVAEGTAKNAAVAGFSIGGKTGTSEKIDVLDPNGNPTLDKIVSFVGIAPMDDPEYIVLVALDTPSRSTGIYISGGAMAAPTVGAVMADILPYLGVSREFSQDDIAGKTVIVEDLEGVAPEEAEKRLKEKSLSCRVVGNGHQVTGQIPAAGEAVPGGSEVLLYTGPEAPDTKVSVPDFSGMNRQQASDEAGKLGIYILVTGNNTLAPSVTVTAQDIPAGTQVPPGTMVKLTFTDIKAAA